MNWQAPWLWPRPYQPLTWAGACLLGMVLVTPWGLDGWQAWNVAIQAQAQLEEQRQSIQVLREQTAQLVQAVSQVQTQLADASAISQWAQPKGLQLLHLRVERAVLTGRTGAMSVQTARTEAKAVQMVHVQLQGGWQAWLDWLAQWPAGVTVTTLELKSGPQNEVIAEVAVSVPHGAEPDDIEAGIEAGIEVNKATLHRGARPSHDPFNVQLWQRTQTAHVQRHPSFKKWVAPHLARPREPLEAYPRERLQYVGHIASAAELHALVRVLPASSDKKEALMTMVHRVRVGHHMGLDWGRVSRITKDHLEVQELVHGPGGEWQSRDVRLPLYEGMP